MKYLAMILLALSSTPLLFEGQGEQIANFAYDACNMLIIPIILIALFKTLPRYKILERGIVVALVIGFSAKFVNYISYMLAIDLAPFLYIGSTCLCLYLLKQACICEDSTNTTISSGKTYFVFKKPKGFIDFLITLFKVPVSSFSIAKGDNWYRFSKSFDGLYTCDTAGIDLNNYVLLPVKNIKDNMLKDLVGTKWSLVRNNCVTAFKPAFASIGIELGKFDFIPSIFAYKFFKKHHETSKQHKSR